MWRRASMQEGGKVVVFLFELLMRIDPELKRKSGAEDWGCPATRTNWYKSLRAAGGLE